MNLILVTEYFPVSAKGEISGGVEARAYYLAKEVSKKNKVKVITSWRKGQPRKNKIGLVEIERVGPHHEYSNKGSFFSRFSFAISAYKKIKAQKGFDLVDGLNFTTYIPAYLGARKIKAKANITYHETWLGEWIKNKGFITGLIGEILERTSLAFNWDTIISVSNFTKNKLKEKGITKDIKVVYNGVFVDDFKKIKAKKDKQFRLVCVSRLVKTKRQEIILKALKELNQNIKLVLVGSGDDADYFKKKVKEMNLEKQVKFTGFLKTREEVLIEIKKSHIFCMPSAVEGFGMTVIESMASEVPVICSDIPPLKEVTKNGECGLIFKLDNYKDLTEKIKLLQKDKKIYKELKQKGLERAKYFDWKSISQQYLKAIK